MGNAFGGYIGNGFNLYFHPEIQPDPSKEPTFDPNLGFPNGRKERGECLCNLLRLCARSIFSFGSSGSLFS